MSMNYDHDVKTVFKLFVSERTVNYNTFIKL